MKALMRRWALAWLCAGVILACGPMWAAPRGNGGGNTQRIPYRSPETDAFGNQWYVYQGGWFRQVGNMPIYGQGCMLTVNGNQPSYNSNTVKVDDNGDLLFENMQAGNCSVTRRLQISKDEGYIRIIDVFKNTQAQDQQVNINWSSSINFGLQGSQTVTDNRKKDQVLGVIAQDGQGRNIVEIYGGRGAKQIPEVTADQNNQTITAQMTVTIKAGKEVAFVHVHYVAASNDAGVKFVAGLKESQLLKDVPKAVRRVVCNFVSSPGFIGEDLELLRGDAFDVIELRGGDSVKGTLKAASWKLNTFYGPVELAADHVIAMVNIGAARPRQLLVTDGGEIYGGTLAEQTIPMELSSGQTTQVPLSQVTRLGYRKRAGENEEWTFEKPLICLRSGDRIAADIPPCEVEVATRYGSLKIQSQSIAFISLIGEEGGLPCIDLTDGSHFTGLVVQPLFEMKLANTAGNPVVRFPTSSIARLQWTNKMEDTDDTSATFKLAGEDLMVGHLTGSYKLHMAFDTLVIGGPQIKKIVHSKTSPADVQLTLWDDTTVSGQMEETELDCQLKSGLGLKIPLALLSEYWQPLPVPSDLTAKQVTEIVKQLNADDWKERDAAQAQLAAMGPAIAGLLRELRAAQTAEGQQRIDVILNGFKNNGSGKSSGAAPGGDARGRHIIINQMMGQ